MERELEELKGKKEKEREGRGELTEREEETRRNSEWKERIKELERRWEVRERNYKRRNILIKGLKVGEGG